MIKYLNNHGTRRIVTLGGVRQMDFYIRFNGKLLKRKADYYGSFGNFGTIGFRFRGKRYEELTEEAIDGVCVVNL